MWARRWTVLLLLWSLTANAVVAQPAEDRVAEQDDPSGAIVQGVVVGTIMTGLVAGISLAALGPAGRVAIERRGSELGLSQRPVAGIAVGGVILAGGMAGGAIAGARVGESAAGAVAGLVGGAVVAAPMGFVTSAVSGALDVVPADVNTLLVLATSGSLAVASAGGASAMFAAATACGLGHCAAADQLSGTKMDHDSDDTWSKERAVRLGTFGAGIGCIAGSLVGCSPIFAALEGGDVVLAAVGPVVGSAALGFAGAALAGEPVVGLVTAAGATVGSGASVAIVTGGVWLFAKSLVDERFTPLLLGLPLAGAVAPVTLMLPFGGAYAACLVANCQGDADRDDHDVSSE